MTTTYAIEDLVLEKLRNLPRDRKQEVLTFVEFLESKSGTTKQPRQSVKGLWADLNVEISAKDLAEARREMLK